ncbi:MAG: L-threonylcarbamoyladenylate synthase [Richelia sp.]|nr:L-threonylcarbamoyladenylate synthase [Richelia sp.]CDN11008.1 TsaC protein (YrdC domain) required for threonylcarbamoyladenosine t(6)A37 modification in tRNA [Richelia intracellularis]
MSQVSTAELIAGAIAGKLVSFPTDTVPALAALPEKADFLFTAKQRSQNKPLILMAASANDLWSFVQGSDTEYEIWRQVARKYWPGALTLVLPASTKVPPVMNPMNPTTIGIRVPDSAIAQQILVQTGPLATTSANLSGQTALQTMVAINNAFPQVLTFKPMEGHKEPLGSGFASTVTQWESEGSWQVLRQGKIKL